AINVGMLDQYFCANACLILPKISTSVKDTLNDGLTNKWPVQAKIEIAWFGDCDFCNAWNMHIPQHRCQPFGNEQGWASQLILTCPCHNRHRIVAKAGLCRKT